MDTDSDKEIVSREAWPEGKPAEYDNVDSGEWGYLIIYSDHTTFFDKSVIPTRQEKLDRWGYLFTK